MKGGKEEKKGKNEGMNLRINETLANTISHSIFFSLLLFSFLLLSFLFFSCLNLSCLFFSFLLFSSLNFSFFYIMTLYPPMPAVLFQSCMSSKQLANVLLRE